MAKYNWKQLEKEYILCDYKSVKEFLENKNMKYNGNARDKTKGWTEKRVTKQEEKSNKTVEKTIEKESEKEAQQIVDIKSIANDLALNIIKANKETNLYIDNNGKEQKGLIDRKGLKQLTSALKDLNEILTDKKENDFSNINQNIQNIAYLINNPKPVRTEDDINE